MNEEDMQQLFDIPGVGRVPPEQQGIYLELAQFIQDRLDGTGSEQDKFRPNLNFAHKLLEAAKRDLAASKALSTDKANSIYHLQQSVEKITKAYGLALGVVTRKEVERGVGHISPRLFIIMLHKRLFVSYAQLMKSFKPQLNTDTTKMEELIETKRPELARMNDKSIRQLLDLMDKIEESLNSEQSKKELELHTNVAFDTFSKFEGADLAKLGALQKLFQNPTFFTRLIVSFLRLYLFSVVTYPHFAYTRYPGGEIEPDDYNDSLGIVKMAPEITVALERSIKNLEEYLEVRNAQNSIKEQAHSH